MEGCSVLPASARALDWIELGEGECAAVGAVFSAVWLFLLVAAAAAAFSLFGIHAKLRTSANLARKKIN